MKILAIESSCAEIDEFEEKMKVLAGEIEELLDKFEMSGRGNGYKLCDSLNEAEQN